MKKKKFVLLASQRTGSNLLNSILNQYNGITMHGEVFNEGFVGLHKEYHEIMNITRENVQQRNTDPRAFLDSLIEKTDAEAVGFHLFPNHNEEILNHVLNDDSYVKIGLRRSLFPSFISLMEAQQTDVWMVGKKGNDKLKDIDPIIFNPQKFERFKRRLEGFWSEVHSVLKSSNQKHFPIYYSTVKDINTINELVRFVGLEDSMESFKEKMRKQSKSPLRMRVTNYDDMVAYAQEKGLEGQLY